MHSMRVHEDTIVIVVIWVNSRAGSDGLVKHGNPFQVAIVFPRAGMMFMRSLRCDSDLPASFNLHFLAWECVGYRRDGPHLRGGPSIQGIPSVR